MLRILTRTFGAHQNSKHLWRIYTQFHTSTTNKINTKTRTNRANILKKRSRNTDLEGNFREEISSLTQKCAKNEQKWRKIRPKMTIYSEYAVQTDYFLWHCDNRNQCKITYTSHNVHQIYSRWTVTYKYSISLCFFTALTALTIHTFCLPLCSFVLRSTVTSRNPRASRYFSMWGLLCITATLFITTVWWVCKENPKEEYTYPLMTFLSGPTLKFWWKPFAVSRGANWMSPKCWKKSSLPCWNTW